MATALKNKPPTPTIAMMTEQSSSSSSADDQQQHLSSSSSTVSQSPIQEDNDLSADSCSNYTISNVGTSTSSLQPQQRNNANTSTIINPYKKQTPNPPSSTQQHQDPNTHKRRQFIEKYRLQAVHTNNTHYRQRGKSASVATSKSALEVMRLNQEWRQQWRRRGQSQQQQQQSGDDSCAIIDNGTDCSQSALRPRLFLFQRMMPPQRIEHNSMTTSQQQQYQQQQGVWELGTGINEISGEGGSGKTQTCLGLCLTCALTPLLFVKENGNNNSNNHHQSYYTSIYITMGEGIPQSKIATRLHQMLGHRIPNNNNSHSNAEDDPDEMERILSRIWLLSLKNEDDFIEFIEVHLPNILNNQSHGIKPQQQQRHQQPLPNNQYQISNQ